MSFALLSALALSGHDLVTQKEVSVALNSPSKATVVLFLSSHCPCSAGHEAIVTELNKKYASHGFLFLGIHSNANESISDARAHFANTKLPFPVIQDDASKYANQFGALKTPHAFVVSHQGEILFSGGIDDSKTGVNPRRNYLDTALAAVDAGKQPDPKEVKTLGCVIERP
jgi:hypothetical protein